jgi:hypothetical protein
VTWPRCVVLFLSFFLGLLLWLASRLTKGGATASLLCGAHIASKLGCTEVTSLCVDRDTQTVKSLNWWGLSTLLPLVDRCTRSVAPSTSRQTLPKL